MTNSEATKTAGARGTVEAAPANVPVLSDVKCPYCDKFCMMNSATSQPFATCFACRNKCPNWLTCGQYRPRYTTKDGKKRLRPTCPRCKFGDNYRPPVKGGAVEAAPAPAAESA